MTYLALNILQSLVAAVLGTAVAFHVVPPPHDAAKSPSFGLQGYVSEADRDVLDVPQFAPAAGDTHHASTFVTFSAPLSGRCGLAMWDDTSGKTLVSFLQVLDVKEGERQYVHALLPRQTELEESKWPNAPLDHYGITVICAITDGDGAGPQTMVNSEYYEVPVDSPAPSQAQGDGST